MNLKGIIQEVMKYKKSALAIILVLCFSVYYWGIRPSQIRKQCSTITKDDSYQYTNPNYNETTERQKQKELLDYIQCRNDNLAKGDQIYENIKGHSPYPFTQIQYNTLSVQELSRLAYATKYPIKANSAFNISYENSQMFMSHDLEELNNYVTGGFAHIVYAYNGFMISVSAFNELKENKGKYPQCYFPADFVEKNTWEYSVSSKDASDAEYKICLRKNGLEDDKKPTPQEIRKNKTICYQWYGKACDDPNFNPE